MNALVCVMTRFCKEEIAVCCDIEQMFHSFAINPQHRDFLRLLWFKDRVINQPIVEYCMNIHLFGALSSPGVANIMLMTTARESGKVFGDQARNFSKMNFTWMTVSHHLPVQKKLSLQSRMHKKFPLQQTYNCTSLLATVKPLYSQFLRNMVQRI